LIGKKCFFYTQTKYAYKDKKDEFKKTKDITKLNDLYTHVSTEDLGDIITKFPTKGYFSYYDLERDDPNLIKVVEKLGGKANGRFAKLNIVEIPDGIDYEITDYDGRESVEEKHRSWC
jgi:hypothetical protein